MKNWLITFLCPKRISGYLGSTLWLWSTQNSRICLPTLWIEPREESWTSQLQVRQHSYQRKEGIKHLVIHFHNPQDHDASYFQAGLKDEAFVSPDCNFTYSNFTTILFPVKYVSVHMDIFKWVLHRNLDHRKKIKVSATWHLWKRVKKLNSWEKWLCSKSP